MKDLFYRLTGSIPRRLPRNQEEYDHFKAILVSHFGIPDEPQVWALVAGHVTSTPAHQVRKPWVHIANAAKRIAINKLAQQNKAKAIAALTAQLEESMKAESERLQKETDKDDDDSDEPVRLNSDIPERMEMLENLN